MGIAVAITGGGVDFDSAAGLHAWMKEINAYEEEDEWDVAPALALLFTSEGEENGEVVIGNFKPFDDVKPWVFLTTVGAALVKSQRDHGRPQSQCVAASLFCEAWGYTIPADAQTASGRIPADWRERQTEPREELKTVMTLDVRSPYVTISVIRYRGQTAWEEDKSEIYDQGNVAGAMRDLAKFVARKNRSLRGVKLIDLPKEEPDQPSD